MAKNARTKNGSVVFKSLTPLDDRILIKSEGAADRTAGGIFIPGTVSERPNRGEVIARGRGKRSKKGSVRPLDVNVGDFVLYGMYAGTPITIEQQEFLLIREEDVLGVVTK